jgi:hypothetical protein
VLIQLRPIAAWSSTVGSITTTSVPKRRTLRSSRSRRAREARRVSEGMKSSAPLIAPVAARVMPPPEARASELLVSGFRQMTRSRPRPAARSRFDTEQTPPST